MLAPCRHGGDATPAFRLGAEGYKVEVTAGARDRALLIEAGALLAEKVDGNTVINGDHVVEPREIMQVVGVTDIVGSKVLVTVDCIIIPLHIHGEGKRPDALAAVGRKGLVLVGHLAGFDELNKAGIEHLRVDA